MRQTLNPQLDIVFKLLFAHPKRKPLLLSLLRAVLQVPVEDATVLNPELTREAVQDKGVVLDIAVRLGDGRMVDVEMQAESRPGFRRRALYYWARLYGAQLTPGQPYTSLKPVICIVFLSYRELSGDALHSVFELRERTRAEAFSDALQLHAIELPNLRSTGAQQLQGEPELVRWARFLSAETDEDLRALAEEDVVMKQATDELVQLSGDTDARELAKQRELALLTYQFELAAAREEGEAAGEARGRAQGLREAARRLGATGMARQQIAATLGLRLEDIPDDKA
jgi:predicted transposase/invertase (TIGR01784 family)